MEFIFFTLEGGLESVANQVFGVLGSETTRRGDSVNCLGGQYFEFSVFGVAVKLELNSYDYEDEFEYMMSIKKNVLSGLSVSNEVIQHISEVVCSMITVNLRIQVGIERETGIELISPEL